MALVLPATDGAIVVRSLKWSSFAPQLLSTTVGPSISIQLRDSSMCSIKFAAMSVSHEDLLKEEREK